MPELTPEQVGWKPRLSQLMLDYDPAMVATRVIAIHRTGLTVAPQVADYAEIPVGGRWFQVPPSERPTVGDWIVVDPDSGALVDVLERTSVIERLAPSGELQLIAANIDTAFLVTSCNDDFSLARLERYLAAVLDAGIEPVVVLTKADQTEDVESFVDQVRGLGRQLMVVAVNSLQAEDVEPLMAWATQGQSIALLGSSGVGKSTLVNTMMGEQTQRTQAAREEDAKGRHTTTHRSIHLLPSGGVILDSPGMREFQVANAESGVTETFADIDELAQQCRFNDCAHGAEPGCAVQAAIADGTLDERRLQSYFKLLREEQHNTETIAQRHARMRSFGRMVKKHVQDKRRRP